MFYILESQQHSLVGMISYRNSGWGMHFTKGNLLDSGFNEEPLIVELESNHDSLPDYFELTRTPIVSDTFIRLFKIVRPENYQLFPVTIKMPGRQIEGYSILNVVGRVSCIDESASDTRKFKSKIMRMNKMVLKKDIPGDFQLFRAQEYLSAIFISEQIKTGLEAGSLTGILMSPAEGWSDQHQF